MELKIGQRPCPVCTPSILTYRPTVGVLHKCAGLPDVVCCQSCGMVYADAVEDVNYSGGKYAIEQPYDVDRYRMTVCRMLECGVGRDALILDVGCGSGGLMKALVDQKFEYVHGTDPSGECTEQANKVAPTRKGMFFDERIPMGRTNWDCVILSHVLEHIRDARSAMQKLREVANSVYIEIPDGLRYGEHVKSPYQHWNREHVSHFGLKHLNNLFTNYDFQLRACGEYNCEPDNFPAIWAWFTKRVSLRDRQQEYGLVSANAMQRIEERIKAIKGPVIAWGIGALARRLWPLLKRKAMYVVDNYPAEINELTAGHPNTLVQSGIDYPILVTTILHQDEVLEQIKRMNLKNEVITLS